MRLDILGWTRIVRDDGTSMQVGGAKLRLLLAVLAVRDNRPVNTHVIEELLWGENAPRSSASNIQTYVWQIRRMLQDATPAGGDRLSHLSGSYRLDLAPEECDFLEVSHLYREAVDALQREDVPTAFGLFTRVLDTWHGNPFPATAGSSPSYALTGESRRAEELYLSVHEGHLVTALLLGRYHEVIVSLQRLIAEHPLRERLHLVLMCALWLNGNPSAALQSYHDLRDRLVEELGTDPGRELQHLQWMILQGEGEGVSPVEALKLLLPGVGLPRT